MTPVIIKDVYGKPLRARVEAGGAKIILHSRSGSGSTARNPDYRPALELILARLEREGIRPDVFLDSGPVQAQPLETRLLAMGAELTGSAAEQFDHLIRRSNAGSRSHGAWRRLMLRVPWLPDYALASIIDGSVQEREARFPNGLPNSELEKVEGRHISAAVAELSGSRRRITRFDQPTRYLLIPLDGGPRLPPKMVFGIALAEALQTHTTPDDFKSGEGIFKILRRHGFNVVTANEEQLAGSVSVETGREPSTIEDEERLPVTYEERQWIEGNPKLRTHLSKERSGGLPAAFKVIFRRKHQKLFCQSCERDFRDVYPEDTVESCFEVHHTTPVSEMATGHRTTFDDLELLCANCHRVRHRQIALGKA